LCAGSVALLKSQKQSRKHPVSMLNCRAQSFRHEFSVLTDPSPDGACQYSMLTDPPHDGACQYSVLTDPPHDGARQFSMLTDPPHDCFRQYKSPTDLSPPSRSLFSTSPGSDRGRHRLSSRADPSPPRGECFSAVRTPYLDSSRKRIPRTPKGQQ
jgi:hypothetical protein